MSASAHQRVQVRLPVPHLWRALKLARRPKRPRSATLMLLRIAAIALAVGLQVLFVLELMKPSAPLPLPKVQEELELILDDVLAAAADDGGIAIPLPRLSGGPRQIAQAPLRAPQLRSAAAPATPQLATAPPSRVVSANPRAVPLSAPALTAPQASRPVPAQLALPSPSAPTIARPRVLQVDPAPVREWAPDPVALAQPSRPEPPRTEAPPVLPRAVLAPDKPTLSAQPPAAVTPPAVQIETPALAAAAPMPRVALDPTEPVPRADLQPAPLPITPQPPQLRLAPNRRPLQVETPVALQAPSEPVPPPQVTTVPLIEVAAGPSAPVTPLSTAKPVARAPLTPPEPVPLTAVTPVSIALPVPNRSLLSPQRQVDVAQATPDLRPADAATAVAVQAADIEIAAPNRPDPASLRAVTPETMDPRALAAPSSADAPARERPQISAATTAIGLAEVSDEGQPGAAPAASPAGRNPVASEFDGIGPARGPATSAADLLAGVSDVARDQVTNSAPGPGGKRQSFLDRRHDPFFEDLPNRLASMEQSEPGGLRQVLSFLSRSLQGGGVTVRGRKLEAGAESLNRPLPREEDVEAALGMLLDRWLEQHDGDVRRACESSYADMNDVVRQLLCAPEEASGN